MKSSKHYFLRLPGAKLGEVDLKTLLRAFEAADEMIQSFAEWKDCKIQLYPDGLKEGSTMLACKMETTFSEPSELLSTLDQSIEQIHEAPPSFRKKVKNALKKTEDFGGLEFYQEDLEGQPSHIVDISTRRNFNWKPKIIKSWGQLKGYASGLDLEKRELKLRDAWTEKVVRIQFPSQGLFQDVFSKMSRVYDQDRICMVVTGEIELNESTLDIEKVTAAETEIIPAFRSGADILDLLQGTQSELNEKGADKYLRELRES